MCKIYSCTYVPTYTSKFKFSCTVYPCQYLSMYMCIVHKDEIIYPLILTIIITVSRKIGYKADNAIMIQKNVRMFMAKRQHQPRYRGITKLKTLRGRIEQLNSMCKCIVCFTFFTVHNNTVSIYTYI